MPTAAGRGLIAAALALSVLTACTKYPQLLALAAGSWFVLLIGLLSTPHPRLEITSLATLTRVRAGEPASLVIAVTAPARRRSSSTKLWMALGGHRGDAEAIGLAPSLPRGVADEITLRTSLLARGRYTGDTVVASCTDPLGLFERRRLHSREEVTVIAQPRTVPLGAGRRREEDRRFSSHLSGETFSALRDYQPGDEVRLIHWMATARTGKPVVRESTRIEVARPSIVLDCSGGDDDASLDIAVEVAASLAIAAAEPGILQVGLGAALRCGPRVHRDVVLDALADVRPASAQNGLQVVVPRSATALVVVGGPGTDLHRCRALAGRRDLKVVTVDGAQPSLQQRFPVVIIHTLNDLPERWPEGAK